MLPGDHSDHITPRPVPLVPVNPRRRNRLEQIMEAQVIPWQRPPGNYDRVAFVGCNLLRHAPARDIRWQDGYPTVSSSVPLWLRLDARRDTGQGPECAKGPDQREQLDTCGGRENLLRACRMEQHATPRGHQSLPIHPEWFLRFWYGQYHQDAT